MGRSSLWARSKPERPTIPLAGNPGCVPILRWIVEWSPLQSNSATASGAVLHQGPEPGLPGARCFFDLPLQRHISANEPSHLGHALAGPAWLRPESENVQLIAISWSNRCAGFPGRSGLAELHAESCWGPSAWSPEKSIEKGPTGNFFSFISVKALSALIPFRNLAVQGPRQ